MYLSKVKIQAGYFRCQLAAMWSVFKLTVCEHVLWCFTNNNILQLNYRVRIELQFNLCSMFNSVKLQNRFRLFSKLIINKILWQTCGMSRRLNQAVACILNIDSAAASSDLASDNGVNGLIDSQIHISWQLNIQFSRM